MNPTSSSHRRTHSKRKIVRVSMAAVAAAIAVTGGVLASLGASADPPDTNPATAPIPAIPVETASKSLVATVRFDSRTDTTPLDTEVRFGAAHSHLGDPPLLHLRVLDADGNLLDQFNAWHPLWAFVEDSGGGEGRIILPEAEGTFIVPFDRDAASIEIIDGALNEEVGEVDVTPAIRDFCEDHPTDPSCRVADLAVTRVEATSVPPLALVGATNTVTVETDVTNLGPSTPMDATVSYSVTADPGVTVAPTTGTSVHNLTLNEVETNSRNYDVSCTAPGLHDITFKSAVAPTHPADVDLNAANNEGTETITVDCVVPMSIDIKPGNTQNPINVTVRNGSVPVALLTTSAGQYGNPLAFDATKVNVTSVHFGTLSTLLNGGGAVAQHGRGQLKDTAEFALKKGDGDTDLLIHFQAPIDTGLNASDNKGCVLGSFTVGGTTLRFFGCDNVRVLQG